MNNDLSLYTIALVIALVLLQTLFHFSKPTRSWIISGTRKVVAAALNLGNRFLHFFLMSPVKARANASKNSQE